MGLILAIFFLLFTGSSALFSGLLYAESSLFENTSLGSEKHRDTAPDYLKASLSHTPLFRYVSKEDEHYHWQQEYCISLASSQGIVQACQLKLVSQRWPDLPKQVVNHPIWEHRLMVYYPPKRKSDQVLLMVSGGSRHKKSEKPFGSASLFSQKNLLEQPKKIPKVSSDARLQTSSDRHAKNLLSYLLVVADVVAEAGMVVAELKDIPNQYLTFHDGVPRKEDEIIAFSFLEEMKTASKDKTFEVEQWPALFPMVKATVRAMDAISEFIHELSPEPIANTNFILTGASKRAWTSWLTAALDQRVTAIVPIVFDALNINMNMRRAFEVYQGWPEALVSYYDEATPFLSFLEEPSAKAILEQVDPWYYKESLQMPKYILTASQDEYFLPNGTEFYLEDLPGSNYMRTLPNTGHMFVDSTNRAAVVSMLRSIMAFVGPVSQRALPPHFSWHSLNDFEVNAVYDKPPLAITLWQAFSDVPDFRKPKTRNNGPFYKGQDISNICKKQKAEGSYDDCYISAEKKSSQPDMNWTAWFVEFRFDNDSWPDFIVTTPTRVSQLER